MSYQISINVVGGEAKVVGQSGTLPDEIGIQIAGHEDDAYQTVNIELIDKAGQYASAASYARKPKVQVTQ